MSHIDFNMLLSFILLLIIATGTAYYANRKGRNPMMWFVIGMLLGIFAPLLLLFFPAVKNEGKENGIPTMTVSRPDPSLHSSEEPSLISQEGFKTEEENRLWYYLDQSHEQMGPVSVIALRELWKRGELEITSYVWSEGMEQWERVDNLPELKHLLNK